MSSAESPLASPWVVQVRVPQGKVRDVEVAAGMVGHRTTRGVRFEFYDDELAASLARILTRKGYFVVYGPEQSIAAEGESDPCSHRHPPEVPSEPCGAHEAPRVAPVLYERKAPFDFKKMGPKVLRWHRKAGKGGHKYESKGRSGTYCVSQRKPDRRHGILPIALTVDGRPVGPGFDTKTAAQAFAQNYENVAPYCIPAGAPRHAAEEQRPTPTVTLQRDPKKQAELGKLADVVGPVDGPAELWKVLEKLRTESQEVFVVVGLNVHDKLSSLPVEVHRGARADVGVDPSIVLQGALAADATSFYVAHNHPGMSAKPSEADIALTDTIARAAQSVELEFRDHAVVSSKGIYMIRARKMWEAPASRR